MVLLELSIEDTGFGFLSFLKRLSFLGRLSCPFSEFSVHAVYEACSFDLFSLIFAVFAGAVSLLVSMFTCAGFVSKSRKTDDDGSRTPLLNPST